MAITKNLFASSAIAFGLALGSSAEAGVKGNHYSGQFTNSNGDTATSCIAFDVGSSVRFDQQFPNGSRVGFSGSFAEADFLLLSFWSANFGGSSRMEGVSFLFGVFTTMTLNTSSLSASGFYTQSSCLPVMVSPPGELAYGPARPTADALLHPRRSPESI